MDASFVPVCLYGPVRWILEDGYCYHMTFNSEECEIYGDQVDYCL